MKFKLLMVLLLGALLTGGSVFALTGQATDLVSPGVLALQVDQPTQPAAATTIPASAPDAVPPKASDPLGQDIVPVGDVIDQGKKVYDDWKAVGWMAGVAALCGFFLLLLRIQVINDWLTKKDWKKYKPYMALPFGAGLGFFGTYVTGVGWGPAIIAGLMAAGTATGWHQLATAGNTKSPGGGGQ